MQPNGDYRQRRRPQQGGGNPNGFLAAVIVVAVFAAFVVGEFKYNWIPLPSFHSTPAAAQAAAPAAPAPPANVGTGPVAGMSPCSPHLSAAEYHDCQLAKNYAAQLVPNLTERGCLDQVWIIESNWRDDAVGSLTTNGRAQGIPQALGHGHVFDTGIGNWKAQVAWGWAYIKLVYHTACKALTFHFAHGWY